MQLELDSTTEGPDILTVNKNTGIAGQGMLLRQTDCLKIRDTAHASSFPRSLPIEAKAFQSSSDGSGGGSLNTLDVVSSISFSTASRQEASSSSVSHFLSISAVTARSRQSRPNGDSFNSRGM